MPTLDWAADTARDAGAVVASGFQSKLEKQAFDFLARGQCGIILVLNRGMYRRVPDPLQSLLNANRLLIVSLLGDNVSRPGRDNAARRNRYIADISSLLVLASLHPDSSLNILARLGKPTLTL